MTQVGFLQEIVNSIAGRGWRMLDFSSKAPVAAPGMQALCEALLSSVGEASGIVVAERVLAEYALLNDEDRLQFFRTLHGSFGIDADAAVAAAERYRSTPSPRHMQELQASVEPRRQELLRRLNLAPAGTVKLVRMREHLLEVLGDHPELREVDLDFLHLFQSWFNRGFLELRRIEWRTPAIVLEKIIRYEAVHRISDWDELRRRIDPADRRLYAFFHPRLEDEPLIFVEVALTADMPGAISSILSEKRASVLPEQAQTAVFYSISNCQTGLRGVSFGNFLIKQVVEDLRRELPGLKDFVTLSPVPGFGRWLDNALTTGQFLPAEAASVALEARRDISLSDPAVAARLEPTMLALAAFYLTQVKSTAGAPIDPVARFHLGNGARLERINWKADLSPEGLRSAAGVMVNYAYRPGEIERNHEAFANAGTIACSPAVTRLARQIDIEVPVGGAA